MMTRHFVLAVALVACSFTAFGQTSAPPAAPTKPAAPAGEKSSAPAIPADAEHAAAALKASPRHGEWVNIALAPMKERKDTKAPSESAAAATLKSWVVYPERKDAAPVVLVVHEIFGMADWVRAVADQLAAEGFIAVAPDLLSGKGPNGGGTESFKEDAVRGAISQLKPEEVAERLDAARSWALAQPSARKDDAVGCIGFCWGGSTTFDYATRQQALKAAVVYYGTAPTEASAISRVKCEVLGLYGGDDARVTSTVEATTKAMKDAGKSYTAKIYPGAGHGFLRQQSGRDGANLKAAQDAWKETIALLKTMEKK